MFLYRTVYESGEAEYVVEKSRFITHIQPILSYDEGLEFVSRIKQEYKDATHNVPAIILGPGQEMQWASDDGEPSGTSGLPMLKMIADEGITNVAVVVTRYFGGIKLGTGGLARAYTAAAKAGLQNAGICEIYQSCDLTYSFDYSVLAKLQNLEKDGRFAIGDIQYTDVIVATLNCLIEDADSIKKMMNDLTSGKAILKEDKKGLRRISI
ncbi:MAG: YigZ family protein [Clostridiales bacterium]|nr:YigZ family protein [Candidatus Crickella caballi]